MRVEKWNCLLGIQEVHGECHPGLASAYIKVFEDYVPPPLKILEMGIGEGPIETEMLTKKGYDVTPITIRPWQAEKYNALLMDMHDLRFKSNTFDAIFSCVTLEHSYAPWLVALESWIVLKDGGAFFIVVPQESQYHVPTHPCLLSIEQWTDLLRYAGFRIFNAEKRRFIVKCECQQSDTDYVSGVTVNHDETMVVIVAIKDAPHSEIKHIIEKLKELH